MHEDAPQRVKATAKTPRAQRSLPACSAFLASWRLFSGQGGQLFDLNSYAVCLIQFFLITKEIQ